MTKQRDDMAGEAERNPDFEVSTRLLGSHIQFRDGSTTRLGAHQIAKKLFREARTGTIFDLNEMLSGYYERAKVTPEKLVEPAAAAEALELGVSKGKPALNISFAPGVFGFRANEGMIDIERIDFDVELTVQPKPAEM